MFATILRFIIGRLVLFVNLLTLPRKGRRTEQEQQALNADIDRHQLYQFYACPFCIKVRRQMRRLNLPIECRDARKNLIFRKELLSEGGRLKVPCLRIEENGQVTWLYESNDIIAYLDKVAA